MRIKYLSVIAADFIDHRILQHKLYWLCQRIALSSWWPNEETEWQTASDALGQSIVNGQRETAIGLVDQLIAQASKHQKPVDED